MASRRLDKTLADYVTIAISPVLIMTMVGSLMFYLLAVAYSGEYDDRLRWIMSCFVLAIVLIARISIEEGKERAGLFAIALGFAVGLAIMRFVNSAPLVWGVMAVVWWASHKLTYDCTLIDEEEDASGEGLLQVVGLDNSPPDGTPEAAERLSVSRSDEVDEPAENAKPKRKKKPRTSAPGTWVIYFSLAALPLFGLGQWMIPASDAAGRRHIFLLLAVYVASGLGLLLTTSFLGLRRYLRQRKLQMPAYMTGVWLAAGAAMIVAILVLAAAIPRPNPEYQISSLTGKLGSQQRESSEHAMLRDSGQQNGSSNEGGSQAGESSPQPQSGEQREQSTKPGDAKGGGSGGPLDSSQQVQAAAGTEQQGESGQPQPNGSKPGKTGSQQQGGSGGQGSGSGNQGSSGESGGQSKSQQPSNDKNSPPRESSSPNAERQSGSQGEQTGQTPPSGKQPQPQQPSQGKQSNQQGAAKNQSDSSKQSEAAKQKQPDDKQEQDKKQEEEKKRNEEKQTSGSSSPPSTPPPPTPPPSMSEWFSWLTTALRWAFNLAIVLAVLYVLYRYRREIVEGWRQLVQSLRDLWQRLFGGSRQAAEQAESAAAEKKQVKPFSAFADPFQTGLAGKATPEQVVQYSFEALEAWAYEQGLARRPDETPLEFADKIAATFPKATNAVRELAGLYARMAYARQRLSPASLDIVRRFWQRVPQLAWEARAAAGSEQPLV